MNHRPTLIAIILSGFFLFATPLLAADAGVGPAGQNVLDFLGQTAKRGGLTANPDPTAAVSPTDIISTLINVVLGLAGVVFFIQIFVAGVRWMMSEGNEETIKNSKAAIVSASIGLVIAFSAFLITNFVLNRLDNLNPPPAPAAAPAEPAPPGAPLGTCIYPRNDQCAAGHGGWTDLQSNISENACSTLAAQACGDPDLYEWVAS